MTFMARALWLSGTGSGQSGWNGGFNCVGGGPTTPAWVPANAKIHIDFVGGSPQGRAWSEADGEIAIADVISDPSKIVASAGLVLAIDDNVQSILGAAATAMLAAAQTLRFTFTLGASVAPFPNFQAVANDASDNVEQWYVSVGQGSSSAGGYDDGDGDIAIENDAGVEGRNIVCVSYAATSFSMSLNGSATTNATGTAIVTSATQVLLGGYDASGIIDRRCIIEKIDVFDTVADADLPTLSALGG